ncbi:sensor histidine kinase [Demetria terragena]|uniref:sensor histidine kinase n=1 Tax=Demetria terragena TaxID=63959 RepID=UPI0003633E1F|nr:HAMP domain-containing sensor histidine kinase [Demetria terragena]
MSGRGPRGWTLRTKLVVSIVALYLLVTVVTGTATVLTSRNAQLDQVDRSLVGVVSAMTGDEKGRPGSGPPPDVGLGQLSCTTDVRGTVLSDYDRRTRSTVSSCAVVGRDGRQAVIAQGEVDDLREKGMGTTPTTVTVLGEKYRVVSAKHYDQVIDTDTSAVTTQEVISIRGLPLSAVEDSVLRLTKTVVAVSLFGLVLIGLAAWWLVRRNLRPLRRVATTAQRVAHLPLAAGEGRTHERVPPDDTDPGTEVGQVGSALNDLLDHVDDALEARHRSELQVRKFVADASHELRTPLASIRGYAELSRRQTEPVPTSVTHALSRIESESDRMTALVEDLLLLARLDAGRPLERASIDLTMMVIESVSDASAAGQDHQWSLDLPDEPCEVIGDEARLRQVLINLLGNARKHTPAGTVITTGVRQGPAGVELTVSDNGPGIPTPLQPHIFERFARGDEARTRREGSTGLGLSIVQAVVSAHGGHVGVHSEPGQTTFTVTLPTPTPEDTSTD